MKITSSRATFWWEPLLIYSTADYGFDKDYCITGRANVIFCAIGLR